ncbi:MAG: hypothetical protein CM15mP83_0880 [Flavobacteriaceae bacterium]|nr:MAG: hypothetical protein CM15mP83_0880 [Flavobacteriaceae bacterium]
MQRHNIPTAAYQSFTKDTLSEGLTYLETVVPPYVLKADGLAAGKGVVILNDLVDAKAELTAMLADAKFGEASQKVVIEEFLDGIELSCFVLTDGKSYKILPMAKDYKRIGEGDTGLNTGVWVLFLQFLLPMRLLYKNQNKLWNQPCMDSKKMVFLRGICFIGLIKVGDNPKVIEYNVRMGDPETQVVLPRIKNDLFELLEATATANLDSIALTVDDRSVYGCCCFGVIQKAIKRGKNNYWYRPKGLCCTCRNSNRCPRSW